VQLVLWMGWVSLSAMMRGDGAVILDSTEDFFSKYVYSSRNVNFMK
jgi:hypothetical protein